MVALEINKPANVIVVVSIGRFDDALRKFKKKMDIAGILDEYKRNQYYLKPSLKKREKRKINAKYR
jgi:ribosomal protein S21